TTSNVFSSMPSPNWRPSRSVSSRSRVRSCSSSFVIVDHSGDVRKETPSAWVWHREAEVPASEAASASCYHFSEHIGVLPIVEAELELREVERQILRAHMMKVAHNATLQKRPERFDCVRVNNAAHVLVLAMLDNIVRASAIDHRVVSVMLIGDYQLDVAVHGL